LILDSISKLLRKDHDMSIPMKRHTSSAVGRRRSHHALDKKTLNKCTQCGKAVEPHTVCGFCGYYKGKEAIKIKVKAKKKKELN
jgi:large subunit ribosomal protein L32